MIDALIQTGRKSGYLMDPDVSDLHRRVHNMLRVGTVSMNAADLDYVNGTVRVVIGDPATLTDPETTTLKTGPLRWLSYRAGPDTSWWAPQKGEQVVVAVPGGNLKRGIIIGSLYRPDVHANPPQDTVYPQPETRETIRFEGYADGTYWFYDRAAHQWKLHVAGGTVVIEADDDVTVTSSAAVKVTAPEIDATATTKIIARAPEVAVQAAAIVHITAPLVRIDGNLLVEGTVASTLTPLGTGLTVPPTPPPAD